MLAWEDESGTTRLSWNDVAYLAMTGALMRADPSDGEPLRTQRLPAQAPYNRLLSRNQPLRDLGSLGQCAIR